MYDCATIQLKEAIAQKSRIPTRRNVPPLRSRGIPCAGGLHRSETAEFHAWEGSIARKLQNPARRSSPPLGNYRIPRAGAVHHSGIAEFHAQEQSIARESWNPTRGRRSIEHEHRLKPL